MFRYNMHGAEMGSLKVYGKVGSVEQLLWQRSGNQGDTWAGFQFRVDTTAQYQVRMVVSVKYSLQSPGL